MGILVLALGLLIATLNVINSAWWVIHNNILFHTDIARDFLLLQDIVVNRNLTLLGPRSGAIPGVFHGPLWLYLNLPAFILGHGNPVVVGWFWVLLSIIGYLVVYVIANKLYSKKVAMLSVVLYSALLAKDVKSLFNPYGALLLFPVCFYIFLVYLRKPQARLLVVLFLLLGLVIQFQMAFGVPILILTIFKLLQNISKSKRYNHLLATLAILPPLSTFIVFDLKHNFLQTKAVIAYLTNQETHGKISLGVFELVKLRLNEMITGGIGMLTNNSNWLTLITIVIFLLLLWANHKKIKYDIKPLKLFAYYYFGFWLISLAFSGPIWSYYYWPFLPLLTIIFSSSIVMYKNIIPWFFYGVVLITALKTSFGEITTYNKQVWDQGETSWAFNYQLAQKIYHDDGGNFGYFIYTPDLYGYYPQYAMSYTQQEFSNKTGNFFEKQSITYLLIAPPPVYGKDPNSLWAQKNSDSNNWKTNDLKINKQPETIFEFLNGFKVEKYIFDDNEVITPVNDLLIHSIIFR